MSLISNKVLNYFSDKTKIPTHYNSKFSSLNSIKLSSGEANIQHWAIIPKPIPTFTHNTYTPKNSNSHTNQLNNHSNFSILA